MMRPSWTGLVIRRHTEDGYRDEGRIVHEDLEAGCYYWMPLPELDKHGHRLKHHLKRPLVGYQSELEGLLGTEPGRVSLVPYQPSGLQSHSEATLVDMAADPSRTDRRDIERSLEVMREQWGWIEPFVVRSSIECLLDETAVLAFAKSRARSIGVSAKRIQRAMRAYLLGGRAKEALLPRWDRCNPPGKPKLPRLDASGKPTKRAGRRSIAVRSGFEDRAGIALPEEARRVLRHGWRKYMKRGVTVKRAYALTLAEFYSASMKKTSQGLEIALLPEDMVPTIHQFRRHGPGADPAMSVSRINLGQHRYARNHRPLQGTARDGLMAACQLAYIDSTPEDQNLVSQADPTVLMPQSYNTKVIEGYTGYIAGFYSSFERPSTLTALAALGNAEQDKVEFCRRYGVEITSDEWLPLAFKTVRADNGEVKSEEGIHAMSWSEISAEFTQSYAAERKGPVESAHNVVARGAGHLMAGSSQGRRHERGDEDPAKDACQTHERYMNAAIRKILDHNNTQPVPHLLTLEMRREGVKPTRGHILQWLIRKGYVASTPTDRHTLRTRCLPSLKGVIRRDGIRLFDPRPGEARLIKHLVYNSEALRESGLTDLGKNGRSECRVHVDPSHLGLAWLAYKGTVEVKLQTKDPEAANLTLLEWLQITDSDRLNLALEEHLRVQVLAEDGRAIYDSNQEARTAKRKAAKAASQRGDQAVERPTKREAGEAAIAQEQLRKLGIGPSDQGDRPAAELTFAVPSDDLGANDDVYLAAARKKAARA